MYQRIIAIDFDGCLHKGHYPEIGNPNVYTISNLKTEQKNGSRIILWTCRSGQELQDAVEWCEDHGIYFDAVNKNLPEIIERIGCDPRKIIATEYWDDRARRI